MTDKSKTPIDDLSRAQINGFKVSKSKFNSLTNNSS